MESTTSWNEILVGVLALISFGGAFLIWFFCNLDYDPGDQIQPSDVKKLHQLAPYLSITFFIVVFGLAWAIDKSAIFV